MMTRDQLAELLRSVNVEALHRESGVAIKTIYRLRHKANAPTLDTVEKLVEAAKRIQAADAASPAAAAA